MSAFDVEKARVSLVAIGEPCLHLVTRPCLECRHNRAENWTDDYAEAAIAEVERLRAVIARVEAEVRLHSRFGCSQVKRFAADLDAALQDNASVPSSEPHSTERSEVGSTESEAEK